MQGTVLIPTEAYSVRFEAWHQRQLGGGDTINTNTVPSSAPSRFRLDS
jgi:hypothetical protein